MIWYTNKGSCLETKTRMEKMEGKCVWKYLWKILQIMYVRNFTNILTLKKDRASMSRSRTLNTKYLFINFWNKTLSNVKVLFDKYVFT